MSARLLAVAIAAGLIAGCSPSPAPAEPQASETAQPQALTADFVANLIAADGAAHTVAVLTGPADPTGIDKVFAGMATGDEAWLALAPQIEPELDGMYAEGLQTALSEALSLSPAAVLALLPEHGSYYFVCADAPAGARAKVAAVTDRAVQAAKAECLAYIDGTAPEMVELNAGT